MQPANATSGGYGLAFEKRPSFHLIQFLCPHVFSVHPSLKYCRVRAKMQGKEARKGNEDAQIRIEKVSFSEWVKGRKKINQTIFFFFINKLVSI